MKLYLRKKTTNGRSISIGICAWPTLPSSICSTWRSLWIARLMSTFRDATRMDMTRLWWVHVGACFLSDEAPEMDFSYFLWVFEAVQLGEALGHCWISPNFWHAEAALLRCLKRPCNGVWWSLPMRRCWNDGASWRESTGNMASRPKSCSWCEGVITSHQNCGDFVETWRDIALNWQSQILIYALFGKPWFVCPSLWFAWTFPLVWNHQVGSIQSRVVRGNEVLYEVQWKGFLSRWTAS